MATRMEKQTLSDSGRTDKIVMSEQLNFFETLPKNEQIKEEKFSVHSTVNPLDSVSGKSGGNLYFRVMGDPYFIDLNKSFFLVKLKILGPGGRALVATDKYSVVNLLSHSIIKNLEMKINDKIVTPSYHTYPFKMYINTLLSYGIDAKIHKLQALCYYNDTAAHFNKLITNSAVAGENNKLKSENAGLLNRRYLFSSNGTIELYIPLGVDLAHQPNLLFNKLKLEFNVLLNSKEFVLMCENTEAYDYLITDAKLFMKKIELNENTLDSIEAVLADYPARYFYNQKIVRFLTLTAGQANFWFELYSGKLPLRAVVALNTSEAVNGKYNKNPYNFNHHGIKELRFDLNGKKYPSYDIKPDFSNNEFLQYYMDMHNFAGSDINSPFGLGISKVEYCHGYTLFCVSFTPEIIHDFLLQAPEEEGPMRVDISFKENLTENLTLILWLEYSQRYVISSSSVGVRGVSDSRI